MGTGSPEKACHDSLLGFTVPIRFWFPLTHKSAIANHRLVDFDGEQVRFRWRDYAHGNEVKVMTLDAGEFIRRFLLHVLPRGFTRLRHYGVLANRGRARKLALCRTLLAQPDPEPRESDAHGVGRPSRRGRVRSVWLCACVLVR